jgi:glycosyltransferase involved in cell wall biosynthesis
MHILLIPSWYPNSYNDLSGIFFKEQAELLSKNGLKTGVIAIQEIPLGNIFRQFKVDFSEKYYIKNGVLTYLIQYPKIVNHRVNEYIKLKLFKRLFKKYIKDNGLPELIHLHSFIHGNLALWIKKHYDIPYVVTEHFSGFSREIISHHDMEIAKKVFTQSYCNIAVSSEFKDLLEKRIKRHFVFIPNIVDTNFFTQKPRKNKKEFYFINIASLEKNKNQAMLIEAFHKAFGELQNVKLIIVGEGSEYNMLRRLIQSLELENQISLYGKASRSEVKQLLHTSDAFVLSSEYETFGVVLIEAMSCGLPVLATKSGGPESIITEDKLGVLVEKKEDSMVKGLLQIKENIGYYNSEYIRSKTIIEYSENNVIVSLLDIYKKAIEEKEIFKS